MPRIADRLREQGELAERHQPDPPPDRPVKPKPAFIKQVRVKKADVPVMDGPPPACDACLGERHPDHPVYQVVKYEPVSRRWLCPACDSRVRKAA